MVVLLLTIVRGLVYSGCPRSCLMAHSDRGHPSVSSSGPTVPIAIKKKRREGCLRRAFPEAPPQDLVHTLRLSMSRDPRGDQSVQHPADRAVVHSGSPYPSPCVVSGGSRPHSGCCLNASLQLTVDIPPSRPPDQLSQLP